MSRELLTFVKTRTDGSSSTDSPQLLCERLLEVMKKCAEKYETALDDAEALPADPAPFRRVPAAETDTAARADVMTEVCALFAAVFREDPDYNPGWNS